MEEFNLHLRTLTVHAGYDPKKDTRDSVLTPLYHTFFKGWHL